MVEFLLFRVQIRYLHWTGTGVATTHRLDPTLSGSPDEIRTEDVSDSVSAGPSYTWSVYVLLVTTVERSETERMSPTSYGQTISPSRTKTLELVLKIPYHLIRWTEI